MLKKSLSIILSVVMLIALCPTMTAFGALPTAELTATDGVIAAGTTGVASDNFDDKEITTEAFRYYATNKTTDVFYTWDAQNVKVFNIKSAENSANSEDNVLEISNHNSGQAQLNSLKFNIQTGYISQLTYLVRFTKIPSGTTIGNSVTSSYAFGYMGSGGIYLSYKNDKWVLNHPTGSSVQSAGVEIVKDKWYKVRAVVTGTGALTTYLIDADTEETLLTAARSSALSGVKYFTAAYLPHGGTASDIMLEVDDAKMAVYNQSVSQPSVSTSSIDENKSAVPIDISTVEIAFDQDITAAPASVSLTAEGKETLTATVAKVTNKLNTYTLTLPVMEGTTTYTADLSGFKNAGGLSADNFVFTTGAAAPVITAVTPENGAVNVSAETKSVSLTFDQSIAGYPSALTLSGGATDIIASVTTTDNINFTASWSEELAGNTTYTLNLGSFTNANGVACSTKSISFTTEVTGIVTEEDKFEDASLIRSHMEYTSTSSVETPLYTGAGTRTDGFTTLSLADGYNGGNALQLATGSTSGLTYLGPLRTNNTYSLAEGEKLVATWRFNVKDMATVDAAANKTGSSISMGCSTANYLSFGNTIAMITTSNGKPYIYHSYDAFALGRTLEEDHWYNVYYVVESGDQTIYVVDAQGENKGKLVYKREKGKEQSTIPTLSEESPAYIYLYSGARTETKTDNVITSITNDSQEFLVDDFTMWRIKPEKTAQKLSLVTADEDAVIKKDGKISMTFNQPVMAEPTMLELYKGTTKNELAYSTADISWSDFCTQEVSFSNLQYMTDYTLDYSGMSAVSGADLGDGTAAATLSFSTEADPNEMSITSDISCTGLRTGDTVSFDLYSKKAGTAKVIAAFYERSFPGKLASVEMADASVTAGESSEVEITLTKEHKADYIKVFVWDGFTSLVPMSRVYEVHAPVDTLDVLMIGNSLSEDAGRYLNDVAEADGLTLNLTVKGVGGASLDNHAANLKAELAGRTAEQAKEQMDAGEVERALYFTYENGEYQTATAENQLLTDALKNKQYDVISLQQFSAYTDAAFEDSLPYLAEEIRKLQPNAEIILYQTWSPYSGERDTRNYYFTNTIEPAVEKWTAYTGANVENITVNGEPMKIVSAGKAFYLADNKYDWCGTKYITGDGNTDEGAKNDTTTEMKASLGLWRDYNHASYYGCYLADAVWYEVLTGKKAPVGTEAAPVVASPDGVTAAEHIERLTRLSNIAHQVVMEQNN